VSLVDMGDCGKFENINAAIAAAPEPLSAFDWLVVTDDDVEFDDDFLDNYLAIAAAADFALSQPAHRFASFASFALTRRRFASLVRETRFVESGPLCVVRSDAFSDLVPFPVSRWSYGVDVIWSTLSARRGWRMGIIDGMAIRHCRPVGATYDTDAARKEGQALIDRHGATGKRRVLLTSQKRESGIRTLVTVCRQALTGLQRSFLTPSAGPPAALSEPDLPEAPV
jgi:hypothetical protein